MSITFSGSDLKIKKNCVGPSEVHTLMIFQVWWESGWQAALCTTVLAPPLGGPGGGILLHHGSCLTVPYQWVNGWPAPPPLCASPDNDVHLSQLRQCLIFQSHELLYCSVVFLLYIRIMWWIPASIWCRGHANFPCWTSPNHACHLGIHCWPVLVTLTPFVVVGHEEKLNQSLSEMLCKDIEDTVIISK